MNKYKSKNKLEDVEAIQYTGYNADSILHWIYPSRMHFSINESSANLVFNGTKVHVGQWIVLIDGGITLDDHQFRHLFQRVKTEKEIAYDKSKDFLKQVKEEVGMRCGGRLYLTDPEVKTLVDSLTFLINNYKGE